MVVSRRKPERALRVLLTSPARGIAEKRLISSLQSYFLMDTTTGNGGGVAKITWVITTAHPKLATSSLSPNRWDAMQMKKTQKWQSRRNKEDNEERGRRQETRENAEVKEWSKRKRKDGSLQDFITTEERRKAKFILKEEHLIKRLKCWPTCCRTRTSNKNPCHESRHDQNVGKLRHN